VEATVKANAGIAEEEVAKTVGVSESSPPRSVKPSATDDAMHAQKEKEKDMDVKAVAPAEYQQEAKPNGQRNFIASEFTVKLRKPVGASLGVEVDSLDGATKQICKITDGLVKQYNDQCTDDKRVQLGDFLVTINGVKGSTEKMTQRLLTDTSLEIVVRRLIPWEVTLTQPNPAKLRPLLQRAAEGRSLLLSSADDVLFKDWNASNPDLTIRKYDRIVRINGIENDSALLMKQVDTMNGLSMSMIRVSPD
jgi:hypothetical protein